MILMKRSERQRRKGKYTHLNAEFQRIARRVRKAFLSNQCKEIDENNRMEKTRDLFKKIRDTKGTFHAKMGSINDRNGRDLKEAEDIKNRWQEYTGELYKKDLHDPDTSPHRCPAPARGRRWLAYPSPGCKLAHSRRMA